MSLNNTLKNTSKFILFYTTCNTVLLPYSLFMCTYACVYISNVFFSPGGMLTVLMDQNGWTLFNYSPSLQTRMPVLYMQVFLCVQILCCLIYLECEHVYQREYCCANSTQVTSERGTLTVISCISSLWVSESVCVCVCVCSCEFLANIVLTVAGFIDVTLLLDKYFLVSWEDIVPSSSGWSSSPVQATFLDCFIFQMKAL